MDLSSPLFSWRSYLGLHTYHKGELFKGTVLTGILNEALATRKSLVRLRIENVGEWPWQ